jgi:hypothetical protein
MRLTPSKRPNIIGVSLPSPEDESRSIFGNVASTNYLEFRTMGKVHIHSESVFYGLLNSLVCKLAQNFLLFYTPSSESSGIYIQNIVLSRTLYSAAVEWISTADNLRQYKTATKRHKNKRQSKYAVGICSPVSLTRNRTRYVKNTKQAL